MSLNAVQVYLQEALDGIDSPSDIPAAQAWVLPPPVVNTAEAPQLFIWGGTLEETRHTIPRFTGQKRVNYDVDIWLQYAQNNDPTLLQDFPVLLDFIRTFLRSLNLPIALVDAITGENSVIQVIGERIKIDYPPPVASADQRYLLHTATIHVYITEELVG